MKISIVIPLYNEGSHIRKVINSAKKTKLPIIVVDDGSVDGSSDDIQTKGVKLIKHKVNLGKGSAMKTGADYAFNNGYSAVIFMDSDGQHDVRDIPKFVRALNKGNGVVFGSRNFSYGVPLARYLGNKIASIFIGLMFNIYISDILCGFRAMTKDTYKKIRWESSGYSVETEIVVKVGKYKISQCEVGVRTIYIDKVKGVTWLNAFETLLHVIKWRLTL